MQASRYVEPVLLRTVLDWVRSLSFTLDFDPRHAFLTLAMQCASLAFHLDKDAAAFMSRSRFVTSRCPMEYLHGPSRYNSLQEMLVAMETNHKSSLAAGIRFLRCAYGPASSI